jgi:hypothetical protein
VLHGWVTTEMACPRGRLEGCGSVSKPYPREFGEDVVRVARNRAAGVTLEQVAADFGVHPITVSKVAAQGRRRGWCQTRCHCQPARGVARGENGGSAHWSGRTRCCAGRRRICRRRTCLAARGNDLPARPRAGSKEAKVGVAAHDDLVRRDFTAPARTVSGSPTSPSTRPTKKASSTSARSKTSGATASSATPWPTGCNRRLPSTLSTRP